MKPPPDEELRRGAPRPDLLRKVPEPRPLGHDELSRICRRLREGGAGRARRIPRTWAAVMVAAAVLVMALVRLAGWHHARHLRSERRTAATPAERMEWSASGDVHVDPARQLAQLRSGRLILRAGSMPVRVQTPRGTATVPAGALVEVTASTRVRIAAYAGDVVATFWGQDSSIRVLEGHAVDDLGRDERIAARARIDRVPRSLAEPPAPAESTTPGTLTPAPPSAAPSRSPLMGGDASARHGWRAGPARDSPAPPTPGRSTPALLDLPEPRAAAPSAGRQPSSSPLPSSAIEEARIIAAAVRTLRVARDPDTALLLLDDRQARFASGAFQLEADRVRLEALLALRRHDEALSLLAQQLRGRAAQDAEMHIVRGEILLLAQRCAEAKREFDGVLARPEDDREGRARYGRAFCELVLGDEPSGRADLRLYLARHPGGAHAAAAQQWLAASPEPAPAARPTSNR